MEDKKATDSGELETTLTGRRDLLKASVVAAAAGVAAASGMSTDAEAQEGKAGPCDISEGQRKAVYGRSTRFCIVPHDSLAMSNNRSNEEVSKAQKLVTDDLLNSLETFVRAARAGKLEGAAVLGLACAEW